MSEPLDLDAIRARHVIAGPVNPQCYGCGTVYPCDAIALCDENDRLRVDHRRVTDLVNSQAEDDGLWFDAQTAPEAYLQMELRRLHAICEYPAALHTDAEGGGDD